MLDGMARALWLTAYASWVEGMSKAERKAHGDVPVNLSGINWNNVAPETPEAAENAAQQLAELFESDNNCSLEELQARAAKADDGDDADDVDDELLGHYLAMQAMGEGVSWFDDHEEFEVVFPSFECSFNGEYFDWSGAGRARGISINPADNELALYIDNDGELYSKYKRPIYVRLADAKAGGTYAHAHAVMAFLELAEAGAKKYQKEIGQRRFTYDEKLAYADGEALHFETEWSLGHFRDFATEAETKFNPSTPWGDDPAPPGHKRWRVWIGHAPDNYVVVTAGGYMEAMRKAAPQWKNLHNNEVVELMAKTDGGRMIEALVTVHTGGRLTFHPSPERGVERKSNPAGLTKKGERMYGHVKASYRGSPRAKEIAARTVLARAKEIPGLRRKPRGRA